MQGSSHSINLTSDIPPITTTCTSGVHSIQHVNPTSVDIDSTNDSSLPLVISLPIDAYFKTPASNLECLYERILKTPLPDGWVSENQLISHSCIVVSKVFSYGRINVLLLNDAATYNWTIEVNQCQIKLPQCRLSNFQENIIASLTSLWSLLDNIDNIDKSRPCIGNPDDKFMLIKDHRKGKFVDHSGK